MTTEGKQQRALGDARTAVLDHLIEHQTWTSDTGWRWEGNLHWTLELLGSLAGRGFAVETKPGEFTVTPEGVRKLRGAPRRSR